MAEVPTILRNFFDKGNCTLSCPILGRNVLVTRWRDIKITVPLTYAKISLLSHPY
jgi:hypothetical protein